MPNSNEKETITQVLVMVLKRDYNTGFSDGTKKF